MADYLLYLFGGYLFGAIPFGLILTRLAGYGDIRAIGSGNIGATNVLRTGNKFLALATFLLDAGKGAIAIAFVIILTGGGVKISLITGLGAVLGHCYPVWLKFKGGKGVSTALGTLLAAVPLTGLAVCLIWMAMAFSLRISSLSALTAFVLSPLLTAILYGTTPALIVFAIAAVVFFRHKDNIKRLLSGTEPKIGNSKKDNQKKADEKPVSTEV